MKRILGEVVWGVKEEWSRFREAVLKVWELCGT